MNIKIIYCDENGAKELSHDPPECRCEDCGKIFLKGEEGDNEKFCLRCEAMAHIIGDEFHD